MANPANGTGWAFADSVVTITANGNYTVTGTTTANRIVINKDVTATVTLQNANIHSAVASPFALSSDNTGGSQVTLILSGNNELVTTEPSSAGLTVTDSAKITIEGNGSLLAQGGDWVSDEGGGAGIGGGDTKRGGNITIAGGTINATGGMLAAGIGSGSNAEAYSAGSSKTDGGNITITGGTVIATGGFEGAGIGGGCYSNGGNITVTGGTITATGGSTAAGIGGGAEAGGGNITITGGTVIATGGNFAAGIGSGSNDEANSSGRPNADGGNITISGGVVVAVAIGINGDPAGIGGGGFHAGAGIITISGGTVYASGRTGAGIGGGSGSTEGVINITGGTVIADKIGIGNGGRTETHISGENTIALSPAINTATFGGAQVLTGTNIGVSCSVLGGYIDYKVTLHADLTIPSGCTLVVPAGIVFDVNHKRLTVNGELVRQGQVINEDYIPPAPSVRDINLSALDNTDVNGDGWVFRGNVVTITASGDRTITGSSDSVRVVIEKNVTAVITLDNVRIHSAVASPFALSSDTIAGGKGSQVTLILSGNNELVTTNIGSAGLTVEDSAKITIQGSGSLLAQGAGVNPRGGAGIGGGHRKAAGIIIINSGTVTATGGFGSAGIGGGYDADGGSITITGGTITATGGYQAAGIGGGFSGSGSNSNITITAGAITATGGEGGAGIGGGAKAGGGNVTITITIIGGTITATGGRWAAGIGGGMWGDSGGNITITGGSITATGGDGGSGMGGGYDGDGGNISISNGIIVAVTAGGAGDPAGIGGGGQAGAGTINITGGTVYASGGTGPGIGGGTGATEGVINITGGTVIADEIGMGNTTTETHISGAKTIVLSPSINTESFGGAKVLTGTDIGISCSVAEGNIDYKATLNVALTIPGGSTLIVPAGIVFDVNHKGLVNNGIIREYGSIINNTNRSGNPVTGAIQPDWITIPAQTYTGNPIEPAVTVKNGDFTLAQGVYYAVSSYESNINAGTASVTIIDLGDNHTITKPFPIARRPVVAEWIVIPAQAYTGSAITPAVTVWDDGKPLIAGTDYTFTVSGDNVNAGTATVTITGAGNYTGTASKTLTILPKAIERDWIATIPARTYIGGTIEPAVTITDAGYTLVLNKDYTVRCTGDNLNAGTATATVTGTGNYTGTFSLPFTILPKPLAADWITDIPASTYTGDSITPDVEVKDGSRVLEPGTDYILAGYTNNVNAGESAAAVTITGIWNYVGTVSKPFTIGLKEITAGWLETIPAQEWTGSAIEPAVAVRDGSKLLVQDKDYTVWYSGNTNAGTATVTVYGVGNYGGSAIRTFTITQGQGQAEGDGWRVEPVSAPTYTGDSVKPAVVVKDGSRTLIAGTDYSVTYKNNVNTGTATVTVTGKGYYTGSASQTFTILPKPVAEGTVQIPLLTWTGDSIKPNITVWDGSRMLTLNKDYTVVGWTNNINAGEGTVTITGRGNYTGAASRNFAILPKPLPENAIEYISPQMYSGGESVTPAVVVKDGSRVLAEGTEYRVAYTNNVNAGTATATVTGAGNYGGAASRNFTIAPKPLPEEAIEDIPAQLYTNDSVKPAVAVKDGNTELIAGTDYTVAYNKNINPGTATVTVTGVGNYTGSVSRNFAIVIARPLAGVWIADIPDLTYTGAAHCPALTVTDGGRTLVLDTDYTVAWYGNVKAGTATAMITGMGDYGGVASKTFTIRPKAFAGRVDPVPAQTYTGSAIRPALTLTDGGQTLEPYWDYTAEWSDNEEAGEASVAITCTGNYTGSAGTTFTILPKPVADSWIMAVPAQAWTGEAVCPAVAVLDGKRILIADTDYIVGYTDNISAGRGTVTITGQGNYTGRASRGFLIGTTPLPEDAIKYIPDRMWTGDSIEPALTVRDGGTTLVQDTDYTVAYSGNVDAGEATVTVTGAGGYTGSAVTTFTIFPKPVSDEWLDIPAQTYTGDSIKPAVTVRDGERTLLPGADYSVTWMDNVYAGNGTVMVTGTGNYAGLFYKTFTIRPKPVAGEWLDSIPARTYTGSAICPALTIRDGSKTLNAGSNYSVSYSDNVNAGTATVTVTGTGNYGGTATGQFTINPRQLSADWVQVIPDQPYTGSAVNPAVTVTGLTQDVDYTVSCSDNIQTGTATITITGKGNYTGEVTLSFNITTGIKEATKFVLRIIPAGDGIFISGLTPGETFSIYTLQGQLIYQATASSPEAHIYLHNQSVYILYHSGQYGKFAY
ncbi:MAG: Ig-like domain-containing protein [Bacteroidales bacterium]